MKILSASQIRSVDAFTIQQEPVSSLDLMERAAKSCVQWIVQHAGLHQHYKIFCGPGNNGGDGLAIGRLLLEAGMDVSVFTTKLSEHYSRDYLENEKRIKNIRPAAIRELRSVKDLPAIASGDCLIDALFGTGLSRPVTGLYADLIRHINESGAKIISIDVPSGLFTDGPSESMAVVKAHITLSFQLPKLAFMFAENEKYVGDFHLLDIGLDQRYISGLPTENYYLTRETLQPFLKQRKKFSHKGNYGHALIIAGSEGKMGAAVLAVKACLRTGAGLVSAQVPDSGINIMQVACPEAMIAAGEIDFGKFEAAGIGPGLGTDENAAERIRRLLREAKIPLVLDADALNIISLEKELISQIPANTVITPHPKEFERLTGKSQNDFERHEAQVRLSKNHKIIIVLKGAHTCITTPDGVSYFNSTGNPGMARGGSGDILTGMITALLAQDYSPLEASLLGVFLHGLAGDVAAGRKGMDGMIAGDLVSRIPNAWSSLRNDR